MILHPDVARIAKRWGIDAKLIQAVMNAEGGPAALIRAVQCSLPNVKTLEEAIEITCRSATHALSDFVKRHVEESSAFVDFWAQRWAPTGAVNDPHGLNANWPVNVKKGWNVP